MNEKLELVLRVTLDRSALKRRSPHMGEGDAPFFILGLVQALLSSRFSDQCCEVVLESATGLDARFLQSMSSFAQRHQRAIRELRTYGETMVDDQEVLDVLQRFHTVTAMPVGSKWRVSRCPSEAEQASSSVRKQIKH